MISIARTGTFCSHFVRQMTIRRTKISEILPGGFQILTTIFSLLIIVNSRFLFENYREQIFIFIKIGIQKHWFGNNKIEQCVTLYVSPFSH